MSPRLARGDLLVRAVRLDLEVRDALLRSLADVALEVECNRYAEDRVGQLDLVQFLGHFLPTRLAVLARGGDRLGDHLRGSDGRRAVADRLPVELGERLEVGPRDLHLGHIGAEVRYVRTREVELRGVEAAVGG